jgi:hypothetical protein
MGSDWGDGIGGAGFVLCAKAGTANSQREKIHTTSINRTETSQRVDSHSGKLYVGQFEKRKERPGLMEKKQH